MSRVHSAMRRLENRNVPETGSDKALGNLVCALLEELADEVPDDANLETVRADLLAASNSYESGDKKDLAMRFYLTIRGLLRENAILQERTRVTEPPKAMHTPDFGSVENSNTFSEGH
jgi:hypothetical protein